MTVMGGARPLPGSGALLPRVAPRRAAARPIAGSRRRVSSPARSGRRTGMVRTLIGAVLVAFLLGLIYLAMTVRLTALTYETGSLVEQRDDLSRQVQTVETSILRWGSEPTAVEHAQRLGLEQLPTRIRLSAR